MSKARGPYRVDPLGYKKKAMQQALEALKESIDVPCYGGHPKQEAAYHALQEVLANEALDKKAENARGLGLDYEPAKYSDIVSDGGLDPRNKFDKPAQQEPKLSEIFCGVDFADGMLSVCVLRRRADDVAELLHVEHIALQAQQGLSDLDVWKVRALQAEAVIAKFMAEQPAQQEPVAWLSTDSIGERYLCFDKPLDNDSLQPLYSTPPQRTWVGLTLQDREALRDQFEDWRYPAILVDAVSNMLKEKNT